MEGILSGEEEDQGEEITSEPIVKMHAMKPQENRQTIFKTLKDRKSQLRHAIQELEKSTKTPSTNSVSYLHHL